MHTHTSWTNCVITPEARLTPFVRCFAQRDILAQSSQLVQTAIASLENVLAFHLSGRPILDGGSTTGVVPAMHLFGTQTRPPGCFRFSGSFSTFAIFLKPFASWTLFRIPPAEFADQQFSARDVFGPWMTELWFRLAECESLGERIRVATEALLPFAEHASPLTRTMAAAHRLVQTDFEKRVPQLARESCMSVRTFERKFVAEMGLPPKLFARLRRFQLALDRKRVSGTTWLDVAHDLGYFDQMHMVKEFRAFGGDAPSLLVGNCGDYQPSSLDAAL
ncbi:MAG: AraC family transcriptional regulator [Acidobacteriaceae bacterium]|nr:AraC family transcriptional regulator [Acidobacteriaceae bacterium]